MQHKTSFIIICLNVTDLYNWRQTLADADSRELNS